MIIEAHYIYIIKRRISTLISTLLISVSAKYWGIKCGKKIKANGRVYFKRKPKSKIIIGNNCRFNSSSFSNSIGVNRPCMISTQTSDAEIIIGNNCGFSGTVIGAFKSIKIGDNVRCGANTLITDSDWHTDDLRAGESKPVIIEDNVWLGESVRILKGVTVGENSIVGIGSIVTKSIPANVVAAGNPCKIIKPIKNN